MLHPKIAFARVFLLTKNGPSDQSKIFAPKTTNLWASCCVICNMTTFAENRFSKFYEPDTVRPILIV